MLITGAPEVQAAVKAMQAGADKYVALPGDAPHLGSAIADACVFRNQLGSRQSFRPENAARFARLTTRQQQVLHGVMVGHSSRQIAAQLGISPRTVEIYRAQLMAKLSLENAAQVVLFGVSAGLATDDSD